MFAHGNYTIARMCQEDDSSINRRLQAWQRGSPRGPTHLYYSHHLTRIPSFWTFFAGTRLPVFFSQAVNSFQSCSVWSA